MDFDRVPVLQTTADAFSIVDSSLQKMSKERAVLALGWLVASLETRVDVSRIVELGRRAIKMSGPLSNSRMNAWMATYTGDMK